jgi:transposase
MSQKELHRLEAVQKVRDCRLSVSNAAKLQSISRSHMHRLLQAYDREGSGGLVSKKRGRPSNRRYPEAFRNTVLDIVREHYHDFGPTLAAEKLAERHGIGISKETLRQWMTEAGLWTLRQERKKRLHQPRNRRECFGELVQIDGSHHWWFEDRGPKCALLVFIDDATGKLLHLRFARSENTFDYFHAAKAYLQDRGKPLAFYSDKHSIFRTTHPSQMDRTSGFTQFGRALHELNIDIICANTPQPRAGLSVPTRRCRTGWSRNCACTASVRLRLPTPMQRSSWVISMPALARSRAIRRICIARLPRTRTSMVPCAARKCASCRRH